MRFTKMHGLGNDYVYLDAVTDPSLVAREDLPELAREMSDRHRGIGSDGLIVIAAPTPDASINAGEGVRMIMFNADGSRGEMCGNGIRCVAKFAVEQGLVRNEVNPITVQSDAGLHSLRYEQRNGIVNSVTVDMGAPRLNPIDIPVKLAAFNRDRIIAEPVDQWVSLDVDDLDSSWIKSSGFDGRMTCVSLGNPHVVLFCEDVRVVPLEHVGPILETHAIFPQRVNVHFVEVRSRREVTMRTWERGSGITQACGTGASAVCVAGVLTDRTDRCLDAHLPGGDLNLEWSADDEGHVFMTGPATTVFTGQWPL